MFTYHGSSPIFKRAIVEQPNKQFYEVRVGKKYLVVFHFKRVYSSGNRFCRL